MDPYYYSDNYLSISASIPCAPNCHSFSEFWVIPAYIVITLLLVERGYTDDTLYAMKMKKIEKVKLVEHMLDLLSSYWDYFIWSYQNPASLFVFGKVSCRITKKENFGVETSMMLAERDWI